MVGLVRLFALPLLAVIGMLVLAGCRDSSAVSVNQPEELLKTEMPAASPGVLASLLPAPAALPPQDASRRVSYLETDLVFQGEGYSPVLPNANVVQGASQDAHFTTSWTGADAAGLGFCLYDFSIADYDRSAEINYGWITQPADVSAAWIGLANWGLNRWDWFQCNPTGRTGIPGFESYFDGGGRLVAAVVLADSGISRLRWIHVGPPQAEAVLEAWPDAGVSPVNVTCTAAASTTAVGTIENHDWDWNGDGVFDASTGSTARVTHDYSATGTHNLAVRVTTSYGIELFAEATVDVVDPWQHTFGVTGHESADDICWDGRDHIYVAGQYYLGDTSAVYLAQHDLLGNLIWARAWDALEHESGFAVSADSAGNVFVTGETDSYGAGEKDLLLQLWDSDGNLHWTKTWGGVGVDRPTAIARQGDGLYISGYSNSPGSGFNALLLKFNTAGEFQWGRIWAPYFITRFTDVTTYFQFATGTSVHVTGYGTSSSHERVVYVSASSDGDLQHARYWAGGDHVTGQGIVIGSMIPFKAHIMGTMDDAAGDADILLLDVASDTAVSWGRDSQERLSGLVHSGGNLYCCGSTSYQGSGISTALLLKMTTGGAFLAAEHIGSEIGASTLNAITGVPGGGVYACGESLRVEGCTWNTMTGDLVDHTSPWTDEPTAFVDFAGTEALITTGTVHELTDLVVDTGAGATDKLVVGRSYP